METTFVVVVVGVVVVAGFDIVVIILCSVPMRGFFVAIRKRRWNGNQKFPKHNRTETEWQQ